MKENTTHKHSIRKLISDLKLKVWQLEAVVPEFHPNGHYPSFPLDRFKPMSPEHYHYKLVIYRTTYMGFYREHIGW